MSAAAVVEDVVATPSQRRGAGSGRRRTFGIGAAQHGDFVSQSEDLDVLGRV
jgi:hypothetical protein